MKQITLGSTGIQTPQNAFGALPIQRVSTREFDTLKSQKVLQSLETGLLFCQIFIFNI